MGSRKLGFVLIGLGLVGLASLPAVGAAMPGQPFAGRSVSWAGAPGWMGSMHAWMHGSGSAGWGAPAQSPGAREVRITATDFSFSPSEIALPAGVSVNLVLVNEGGLPHDVTIPALGFSLPAAPGTSAIGALVTTRPGTYELFCSVPGHREAGMSGLLRVG